MATAARAGQAKTSEPDRWYLGASYRPHIRTHDVPSLGRSSRPFYDGRAIHLLSNLEARAFAHFRWDQTAVGLEEQYPLDVADTVRIAAEMGVDHPMVIGTDEPFIMTTDLVVYFSTEHGERRVARSMKYVADVELGLAKDDRARRKIMRTLEKLEIERRYWVERGVGWALLTEKDLSEERQLNIEMLLKVELDADRAEGFWKDAAERLRDTMIAGDGARMSDLQREMHDAGTLDEADFSLILRHLCATRQIEFDMERKFSLLRPVSDFQFAPRLAVIG